MATKQQKNLNTISLNHINFTTLWLCSWLLSVGALHAQPATILPSPAKGAEDAALVRLLLGEGLAKRKFSFATVAEACSGKKVLPLTDSAPHRRVVEGIHLALKQTVDDLNKPNSPIRTLRRINEASRYFEDGIHQRINKIDGLTCEIPPNRAGDLQRSGYPDLKIRDIASGAVFYLDPKLVEASSVASTFRTFYFEPKIETLKITDDAVHLLVGIEHDGNAQQWHFTGWRLIDLALLEVRLKAEFQASNLDIYRRSKLSSLSEP